MNANDQPLQEATYDLMLYKGTTHLAETHRASQTAREQKYSFSEPGSYTLRIDNINNNGESDQVNIPIQVTPEFPMGIFGLMAVTFGMIMILMKAKKIA
jgi:hypothetical protein